MEVLLTILCIIQGLFGLLLLIVMLGVLWCRIQEKVDIIYFTIAGLALATGVVRVIQLVN